MSYQVLARKWRPKSFREMAGQSHVLKALINALDHDRLHHAYLFTGTRGVGKTTIARILARCLNCEQGVSSEPCGQCQACVAINEGRFVDLIEVDAASRTKVEDTRELLDNVQYTPTQGRYKVYLIDEVHMLSASSFNALLKTLEEPPPHVKFLLATTDPQKIPATILSRCLQFSLKNLSPERVVDYLKQILEKEMIAYDDAALWLLGRAADGSMRDALSLTDQAIAFGSGKLGEDDVRQMLGTIDHAAVHRIVRALSQHDGAQLLAIVADLAELGVDFAGVASELLVVLHRLAIAQTVPEGLDNSLGDRQALLELAQTLSAEEVQFYYQMALQGRRDLGLAPELRGGLEMLLLRLLAFKPEGVMAPPVHRLPASTSYEGGETAPEKKPLAADSGGEQSPPETEAVADLSASERASRLQADVSEPAEAVSTPPTSAPKAVPAPEPTVDTEPEVAPATAMANGGTQHSVDVGGEAPLPDDYANWANYAEQAPDSQPDSRIVPEPQPAQSSEPTPVTASPAKAALDVLASQYVPEPVQDSAVATPSAQSRDSEHPAATDSGEKISLDELDARCWRERFEAFPLPGMLGSIAAHCQIHERLDSRLSFIIGEANATLLNDRQVERLQEQLSEYFGQPLKVTVELGEPQEETPAQYRARLLSEQLAAARVAIESDPLVLQIIEEFGAELEPESLSLPGQRGRE